jgi:hypothetical protein
VYMQYRPKPFRLPRRCGLHAVLPLTAKLNQLSFVYLDEEIALEDSITDGLLGLIISRKPGHSELVVMLLKSQGEFYQRVGLLRIEDWWDNSRKLPCTAFRTLSSGFLNEVSSQEISPTDPLWLKGATKRVFRVG